MVVWIINIWHLYSNIKHPSLLCKNIFIFVGLFTAVFKRALFKKGCHLVSEELHLFTKLSTNLVATFVSWETYEGMFNYLQRIQEVEME